MEPIKLSEAESKQLKELQTALQIAQMSLNRFNQFLIEQHSLDAEHFNYDIAADFKTLIPRKKGEVVGDFKDG